MAAARVKLGQILKLRNALKLSPSHPIFNFSGLLAQVFKVEI